MTSAQKKFWIISGIAVPVVIAIAVASAGGSNKKDSASASAATPGAAAADPAAQASASDGPASTVNGQWSRALLDEPIDTAGLEKYIQTGSVRCESYEDGTVKVYVTMTNNSAEHVTVNWYPRYSIVGGGIHGDGFSGAQSDGFDSGETRDLISEQHPKGVSGAISINTCSPHFQMIESG